MPLTIRRAWVWPSRRVCLLRPLDWTSPGRGPVVGVLLQPSLVRHALVVRWGDVELTDPRRPTPPREG